MKKFWDALVGRIEGGIDGKVWRNCTQCKAGIAYGIEHLLCSETSCSGRPFHSVFCSKECLLSHSKKEKHDQPSPYLKEFSPRPQKA